MTSTIVSAVASILVALATSQGVTSWRIRKQQRVLATRCDVLEQCVYDVRRRVRAHNDQYHPDGVGGVELPPLPEWMASTDDPT